MAIVQKSVSTAWWSVNPKRERVKNFKLTIYHSLEKELIIGTTLLLIENAVIAMVLAAIGIQTIFTAIFLSVLLLKEVLKEGN